MSSQMLLDEKKREYLVDRLQTVAEHYRMNKETLHLAVNIMDRFFSKKVVTRDIDVIPIVCLYIAAKYEEVYPPEECEYVYVIMRGKGITKKDMYNMEAEILDALKWRLKVATSRSFCYSYLKLIGEEDERIKEIALVRVHPF
jgi:cyclin A